MRLTSSIFILLSLLTVPLSAEDVDTRYLKLQEAYTQRVEDIRERNLKSQRELLNQFILALVRTEQQYRDQADLEGVVYCRDLREKLLLNPEAPPPDAEAPESIRNMMRTLWEKREETLSAHQRELNTINGMLLNALEPYQREYTRRDQLEMAKEINALREVLTAALEHQRAETRATETLTSSLVADPNLYPLAMEGEGYGDIRGVIPRRSMIDLTPKIEGWVKSVPLGTEFVDGQMTLPANETGPLIQDLKRNRMFSAEIAYQPTYDLQGTSHNPVVLFQLGESPETALFSLTLERYSVFLHFKTDTPPPGRENHRHEIGSVRGLDHVHLSVTYRTGELTAYINGVESLQLRNEIKGGLSNWEPVPVIIGKAPPDSNKPLILPFRGTLNHFYLKSGEMSSRQVVSSYNRYQQLFD